MNDNDGIVIPELTSGQFSTVYNLFSLVIASPCCSRRSTCWSRQQPGGAALPERLVVSAIVCGIAAYHYFRIFDNFGEAYPPGATVDGVHVLSQRRVQRGLPVRRLAADRSAAARSRRWRCMALARSSSAGSCGRLVPASALMIVLGYPGSSPEWHPRRVGAAVDAPVPLHPVRAVRRAHPLHRPPAAAGARHTIRMLRLAGGPVGRLPDRLPVPADRRRLLRRRGGFVLRQAGYSIADILAKAPSACHLQDRPGQEQAGGSRPTARTAPRRAAARPPRPDTVPA